LPSNSELISDVARNPVGEIDLQIVTAVYRIPKLIVELGANQALGINVSYVRGWEGKMLSNLRGFTQCDQHTGGILPKEGRAIGHYVCGLTRNVAADRKSVSME